jgi:O-antigen ligase
MTEVFSESAGTAHTIRFAHRGRAASPSSTTRLSTFIPLFFLCMFIPVSFSVGSINLTPVLIFLLALFIPCFLFVFSGNAGRATPSDVLLVVFCTMAAFSLLHSGTAGTSGSILQSAGVLCVQTLGPYLLARKYIRTGNQFQAVVRISFISIILLTPFAAYESFTHHGFQDTPVDVRMGLQRAQTLFEHPILFGVFCASAFAPAFYVLGYGRPFISRLTRGFAIAPATFFSLSAGAVLTFVFQLILIFWDFIMRAQRHRWLIFAGITAFLYFIVDALSHRTPFNVFVSYLTFNTAGSYNRIAIWKFGTLSVINHPIFGIGFNDWERPSWMVASIDNFWLLMAIRHGIPALLLFTTAALIICFRIGRLRFDDEYLDSCRKGLLVSIVALMVAACTVHFWGTLYYFFMFWLGCGEWLVSSQSRTGIYGLASQRRAVSTPGICGGIRNRRE